MSKLTGGGGGCQYAKHKEEVRVMRWAIVLSVILACAVGVVWAGAEEAGPQSATATAAAAAMYLEETVVGTMLEAQRMYAVGMMEWWLGELRVDTVESEETTLEAGQGLRLRYQVKRGTAPLLKAGAGDLVRGALRRPAEVEGGEWTAGELQVLGRGELVNPGEGAAEDLGSPEAQVLVKMLAPAGIDCHRTTAVLLREVAEREGERVRVQIFDMQRPEGRREMLRERLRCATVLVNNRMTFALEGEEGAREVVLSHKPNEELSTYNSEDVITVIEQELRRLYPEDREAEE